MVEARAVVEAKAVVEARAVEEAKDEDEVKDEEAVVGVLVAAEEEMVVAEEEDPRIPASTSWTRALSHPYRSILVRCDVGFDRAVYLER